MRPTRAVVLNLRIEDYTVRDADGGIWKGVPNCGVGTMTERGAEPVNLVGADGDPVGQAGLFYLDYESLVHGRIRPCEDGESIASGEITLVVEHGVWRKARHSKRRREKFPE